MPEATATSCLPPASYVIMPPPAAPSSVCRQMTLPDFASSAIKAPIMSPTKTMPPAVGVTPDITGASALCFQATLPLSASIAVIQPAHLSCGSSWPNSCCLSGDPEYGSPGLDCSAAAFDAFNVTHQSTAPT